MTKLSAERLAEIRAWAAQDCGSQHPVQDLLAHVAALERELSASCRLDNRHCDTERDHLIAERDAWKEYAGRLRGALEAMKHANRLGRAITAIELACEFWAIASEALALPAPGGEHE